MELEFSEQQIELSKDTNNLDYEEKNYKGLYETNAKQRKF